MTTLQQSRTCPRFVSNTLMPEHLEQQVAKAETFLDHFGRFSDYRHRKANPYLHWLRSKPKLRPDAMFRFFSFWYPVSWHQPQILLRIAGSYSDWHDRYLIMQNYLEEDGMVREGDNPHYQLLEALLRKLGGELDVDPEAEALVTEFHRSIVGMSEAEATGYLAAIEHPALDISDYFTTLARNVGRAELLTSDPYLAIHIHVEPKHIIWSHGNALDWIEDVQKQRALSYRPEEVVAAFRHAMTFWNRFWALAFAKLGYSE